MRQWSRVDQVAFEGLLWVLPAVVALQVLLQGVRAARGDALQTTGRLPEELVAPAAGVTGPLTGTVVVQDPTASQYGWAVLPTVLLLLLAVAAARLLLGVARGLREGDPFTAPNARRLGLLGVLVVVGGTFLPFFQDLAHGGVLDPLLPGGPPSPTREPVLWPGVVGLVLFFVAEVFRRGARLREDVEGLV
jgi:hypothetical protein